MVAILLRKGGFKGKITLIGEESLLPYERPPLSKSYLTEEVDFKRLHLRSQKFYEDNEIKLISGFKIDEIDRNKNFVNLEDGQKVKSPVKIIFGLTGKGVAPAGINYPNSGHHHLLVNFSVPILFVYNDLHVNAIFERI